MKKLITILMVLAIVAGFAFADETHTIKVKGDVTEVVPVFGLKLSVPADDYVTNAASLVQNSTSEYTTQYGEGTTYGMTQNSQAIDIGFNLDEEGSVTFVALLLNKAKQNETYDLTFGGGVFKVSRQGTGNLDYAPTSITTDAGTSTTGLEIGLGSAVGGSATNKTIGLTFNGTTVADGGNYTLATAVYAYPGDATIDPTADNEWYYADITLLISAT